MDTENAQATQRAPRGVMEVEMEPTEQGIVVFDGTGSPLHLIDSMTPSDVAEMLGTLVSRRVLVARLRAWADSIDEIGGS